MPGKKTSELEFNGPGFSQAACDRLAASALNAIRDFLAQPGGKEALDKEIELIRAEKAVKGVKK